MNETSFSDHRIGRLNGGESPTDGLTAMHLGKQFKKRPVLRDVSISVQRGEAVGLLGPNGAGKTTCFYIITGLISADTGRVVLDGHDVTQLPMYRRARLGLLRCHDAPPHELVGRRRHRSR